MLGNIRSYLPDEGYGFIRGDDGRDYYFRRAAFLVSPSQAGIAEGAFVMFEQHATPKGYRAGRLALVDKATITTFRVPQGVVTSKSSHVRGWDVLERSDWVVDVATSASPDAAWSTLRERASELGANALLDVSYYKTTDSIGNYYFSTHNVRGRVAVVGRRHAEGGYQEADLLGVDERVRRTKSLFEESASAARRRWLRKLHWRGGIGAGMVVLPGVIQWMAGFINFMSALMVVGIVLAISALVKRIFGTAPPSTIDWLAYIPAPPQEADIRRHASG